ncbi:MAG TPA: trigger factor [Hyphomicrobium sp.]|nr:trigger factor [Hyphomicrobium sp.]
MQVTETGRDGLKRTLKVVVAKTELDERFKGRLDEIKDRVQLKGFRKGKVPMPHLKKVYGKSLMAEVLEQAVQDTSIKAMKERNERPASQPKIEIEDADNGSVERVINGESDLAYSMSFEVLPPIALADFSTFKLVRLSADVEDADLERALGEIAERNTTFEPEEGRVASEGDMLTLDFAGKIDGEPFEGGSAEGANLVLGKGQFIPGFEEGLIGAKAGDERAVKATFPAEYPMPHLAGKEAEFDVKVKTVSQPLKPELDDAFAVGLGAESLEKMKEIVRGQLQRELDGAARVKLKRELLDELDRSHVFDLPPSLVDFEFGNIWRQVESNMKAANKTFPDEGKAEDEAKAEYRKIAERRVRLGLVVGEIGEKNKITVSQDELRRALVEQARRYPGQEKMVYEYYEKTPGALAELRAPIFEDKVIDFIVDAAKPVEKKVGKEELLKQVEEATQKDSD